jgi:tetrahydromethanopterin S-methyltransferase subunit G
MVTPILTPEMSETLAKQIVVRMELQMIEARMEQINKGLEQLRELGRRLDAIEEKMR